MTFTAEFSQILLFLLGIFLMIVILLQRGRGGGLAGAFGGLGGQSAFGTKAGDVFTKITVVIALFWVVVSGGSGFFLRAAADAPAEGLQLQEEIDAAQNEGEPVPSARSLDSTDSSPDSFPLTTDPESTDTDSGEPATSEQDGDDASEAESTEESSSESDASDPEDAPEEE